LEARKGKKHCHNTRAFLRFEAFEICASREGQANSYLMVVTLVDEKPKRKGWASARAEGEEPSLKKPQHASGGRRGDGLVQSLLHPLQNPAWKDRGESACGCRSRHLPGGD